MTGSARTSREVLRDFRTEQILDAARRVVGRLGWADASIDRIAEAAGLARSTVYVYFDSKQSILNGCLAQNRRALGERVASGVAGAEGLEAQLAAFIEAILTYVGEYREFFRAVMAVRGLDPFFGDPGLPPELVGIREESRAVVASILKVGVERGELRDRDLATCESLLGTLLYGALMQRSHDPAPPAARTEARRLARFFLVGVCGSRSPG